MKDSSTRRPLRRSGTWLGVAAGFLVGAAALFSSIDSAGAGHGDYAIARALFPLPMLLTRLQGDTIGLLSILSAIVQFPLYGALIMRARTRRSFRAIVVGGLLHLFAAALCFSGVLPNFS